MFAHPVKFVAPIYPSDMFSVIPGLSNFSIHSKHPIGQFPTLNLPSEFLSGYHN